MIKPELNLLCEIEVLLGPVLEVGDSPRGKRRIIPIIGGTFRGDRFSGTVANVGADWHTVLPGSMAELDTRYCLLTHEGAKIDIRNYGFRHGPEEVIAALARGEDVDPALYYMRTHCRFETGDPRYAWLNHTICVGSGVRKASAVHIAIYSVS